MSLKQIAHQLQAAGRNNDSMLVHMSPREVSGLQSLARQHGGNLSVNPTTGLVEAGFLDSILPMLAGAALTATGVGAPLAAALVGGGTGLATGSVEKGLMAGLGAYGGAGLGSSLSSAGSAAATPAATTAATVTPNAAAIPGVTPNAILPNAVSPTVVQGTSPMTNNLLNPSANNVLGSGFTNTVSPDAFTASMSPDKMLANAKGTIPTAPIQSMPVPPANTFGANLDKMGTGFGDITSSADKFGEFASQNKGNLLMSGAPLAYGMANPNSSLFSKDKPNEGPAKKKSTQRPYKFSVEQNEEAYSPGDSTAEQSYFDEPRFTALPTYTAKQGGLMSYGVGGQVDAGTLGLPDRNPVDQATMNQAIGNNNSFPMSQMRQPSYSSPTNRPLTQPVIDPSGGVAVDPYTGQQMFARGGLAHYADGGYTLGGYSDGGRLLKGPGDGVSDSIPASIGNRQPARLADGEFVVPARIVSEIGNGSTEAGARKLYAMMDRVQKARKKTVGKNQVAKNTKAEKLLPA
jgi:hypothetical protein